MVWDGVGYGWEDLGVWVCKAGLCMWVMHVGVSHFISLLPLVSLYLHVSFSLSLGLSDSFLLVVWSFHLVHITSLSSIDVSQHEQPNAHALAQVSTQQCHRLCATCMVAARQHLPQQQQHAARSQQQQQLQLQQTQAVCPPECPFFGVTPPTQPPTRSSSSCSRKGPAAALPG